MPSDSKFDVRNIERNLKNEKFTQEEYQAYLDSLEDFSNLMVECETKFMHHAREEEEEVSVPEEE